MQAITLLIATSASALVFLLSPLYGLIVYVAALAYYPTYISAQVGTLDFTVRRIVIIALFLKLFLLTDLPGKLRLIWLDKLVLIFFAATLISGSFTAWSLRAFVENRAGAFLDTVVPYFVVRLILQNKQQYLTMLRGILIIAAPLAIAGFYQALTGNNPVGFLKQYATMPAPTDEPWSRGIFFRTDLTFSHYIMYGLFFAMLGPVCAGILGYARKHKNLCRAGLGLMCLGVLISMSGGPILLALLAVFFMALYRWRRHWKTIAAAAVIMCVCVEIISNRHFYEVIDRYTFSVGSSWYRFRLIEVALFEGGMADHWLSGYGWGVEPGWGALIDGRPRTDGVNQYVIVLLVYGLIGLVPFLAMNIGVVRRLIDAYKASIRDSDQWLVWGLSAAFFGLLLGMNSFCLDGQPMTIYYMMIGLAAVGPIIVKKNEPGYAVL